ncbi:hypothetical protein PLANPX_1659 [Lacipirellula parvula]|uniref:Uncharacterized protein n=1 Tax=Lacipirellula parvula TaxID=2650471 RepID=A0A5K7X8A0_9BACT|nr:hypothetical protein PLANPX_1659 [Lacipirellula parvula]
MVAAILAWAICGDALAQSFESAQSSPVLLDNMDGATPALHVLNPTSEIRLLSHAIESGRQRFGKASEHVSFTAPAGTSVQFAYNLPEAIVLAETRLTAITSCNRPGVQLAALVTLKRSIDEETGQPRQLLVRSGKNGKGGDWEQLDFSELSRELPAQVRVARAKYGGAIDEREAFVTHLVILAPGGPGPTDLWVDQIAMYGVLNVGGKAPGSAPNEVLPMNAVIPAAHATPATSPIVTASGKPPVAPRVIQWQGEPLDYLQKLGFDAVWMGRPPVDSEIAEARRLGMFIVCEPPTPEQMRTLPLDARFSQVMAWDLGKLAEPGDLEVCRRWAQAIEYYESDPARPVLLRPTGMTREASRIADLVMIGRPTLGSSLPWPSYGAWLGQQRRLVRGGTPLWVSVETHCGPHFGAQLGALRGSAAAIVPATFHELSMTTSAAFGIAPRGFCFQSNASLAGGEPENQIRSLALELTNLRLGLAEPWLAGGKSVTVAQSSRADLSGLVIKVERSHLIVPMRWSDNALAPTERTKQQPISFKLPGVPESSDAYLLSIAGSQRLPAKRVTGGLQITVDHMPDDAFLLVTEDGYAYSHIERYLRQHAPRAAHARIDLAALRRQQAVEALAKIPGIDARAEIAPVDAQLTAVAEMIQRRDHAAVFGCAAEAERLLDETLRRVAATVAPSLPVGSSPLPLDWTTLAEMRTLESALPAGSLPQSVPGGDFEDLNQLLQAGWQRFEQPPTGVTTAVRLSPEAPGQGAYCLELQVQSQLTENAPPSLPAAPVWVTSPPLQAPPGHMVEISGQVRVPEPPLGSSDPLLIFDSVGGNEGAIRIESSPEWRPFRLLRAPTPGAELRLTIALGGIGRAQIDGLSVRYVPLQAPSVAQTPR